MSHVPVTVATELGYLQGYQAHVEEVSWERQGRGAGYPSPSSSYPGVYWTHYTPCDYFQEVVEQEENKIIYQDRQGHGVEAVDNKQDEEPIVQVEEGGRRSKGRTAYWSRRMDKRRNVTR